MRELLDGWTRCDNYWEGWCIILKDDNNKVKYQNYPSTKTFKIPSI